MGSNTTRTEDTKGATDGRIVVGRALTNYIDFYASLQIDELIYFNQALSPEEIEKLHTAV